ncbi:MAG: SIR2 family protein [Thermomicrobiales bacterium]
MQADTIDWDILLGRIEEGRCTPFVGAGASYGVLPLGGALATHFAREWHYPIGEDEDPNRLDLARVAQFCAIMKDDFIWPKEQLRRLFEKLAADESVPDGAGGRIKLREQLGVSGTIDSADPNQLHNVLAALPLPVYITTNYDNLLTTALGRSRTPQVRFCPWNKRILDLDGALPRDLELKIDPANPLVYHLHGVIGVDASLVLTEDDYVDFLVNMASNPMLIHRAVEEALSDKMLLFIGYRLADWNFRVLFRQLLGSLERSTQGSHVAVQLPVLKPDASPEEHQIQQQLLTFLERSHRQSRIKIFWGSAQDFAIELLKRWKESGHATL